MVSESGDEITDLLNNILNSANNLDSDGVVIYGAGLKVSADNYKGKIENLV
ncbi:hypothetical protein J2128_001749 [Methanomicrobium sp. W14]|uniref:hypothetical protein n=1 Tax=Methanomicrobium sp. W14 TaxID=2817839 RepID=UPI001AE42524|nr:hypothetical protein [Methanomicrobium sp. W14]MBP2133795.1 hypothetical protein [Methanomicrobium sp. W14]